MPSLSVCQYKLVSTCDETGINDRFRLLFQEVCTLKSGGGGGGSYTLPIASSSTLGGVKVGPGLAINSVTGLLSVSYVVNGAYIKGLVDGGGSDDPTSTLGTYQNDKLIGLSVNGRLQIFVDDISMTSWGLNAAFTFNSTTGTITFTNGYTWNVNSSLVIDLKQ